MLGGVYVTYAALVLALLAVALIVSGVALLSVPAALIAAGILAALGALYVLAYADRRRG